MDAASKYESAANAAACEFLLAAGSGAVGAAAWSLVTGGPVGWGAALAITGMSGLAYGLGCGSGWDTGITPNPDGNECWRVTGYGDLTLAQKDGSGNIGVIRNNVQEIISVEPVPAPFNAQVTYRYADGRTESRSFLINYETQEFRIIPVEGTCNYTGGPDVLPPPPEVPPYEWTDPDDGCKITAIFEGLLVDQRGIPGPVFTLKPSATPGLRTSGGIIGGCNFSPVVYYLPPDGGGGGGGGGGGRWIPDLPGPPLDDGTPWWVAPMAAAIGGATGALIDNALDEIFKVTYPATSREIYAACEYKGDGTPETFSVNFPEESYQDRVLASLDAIVDFQQQILLWRTPTCGSSSPKIGDYRTISFISDEKSPNGKSRIAKRFRYRSSSGVGLDGVVEHWRSFTWSAGPVCVQHKDSQLGSPQVWASSIDEGKRVIRHAGSEAGIDPDSVGRWSVGGSDDARYGMPGTMRVNTSGGYYWITSRLGPDQRPPVILT